MGLGGGRARLEGAISTIPVVLVNTPDPVKNGLVQSLGRPGGTITGFTSMAEELAAKRVELLREALPRATRVGVLGNRAHPSHDEDVRATHRAAGRSRWPYAFTGSLASLS